MLQLIAVMIVGGLKLAGLVVIVVLGLAILGVFGDDNSKHTSVGNTAIDKIEQRLSKGK